MRFRRTVALLVHTLLVADLATLMTKKRQEDKGLGSGWLLMSLQCRKKHNNNNVQQEETLWQGAELVSIWDLNRHYVCSDG